MGTGATDGTGGTGTKSNLTEHLDLGQVGGTDIGRTGVRSSGEGRGIVDDADHGLGFQCGDQRDGKYVYSSSP